MMPFWTTALASWPGQAAGCTVAAQTPMSLLHASFKPPTFAGVIEVNVE